MKQAVVIFAIGLAIMLGMRLVFLPGRADPDRDPDKDGPRRVPALIAKGDWGYVDLLGFRLCLPRGFRYDRSAGPDGHVFSSSPVHGFRPNVHLYWVETKLPLRDFFDLYRSKYDGGDARILGEGAASTAGMAGFFLIYRRTVTRKGKPDLITVTKDFYFGKRDGRCGILRGICAAATFPAWQPILDQAARKLSYKG